ncbi:hypothetical protein [Ferrovum myxofaciens]|uniref:hypothetical protein n=1 Tax=Ferrovum myxofaciens TaxID=416213 RepID=UPI0004E213E8|nr:hypothetical protein [Ferrovum myxofaciens]
MNVDTLIRDFTAKRVHLAPTAQGTISITSQAPLTDADRDLLRKHKADVLAELGKRELVNLVNIDSGHYPLERIVHTPETKFIDPQTVKTSPALDLEDFQERAGIMEYEGGMSRPQAEFLARCDQCRHFSRFGNCRMPQESGLTVRFEIVQAPGEACGIFERKPPPVGYLIS